MSDPSRRSFLHTLAIFALAIPTSQRAAAGAAATAAPGAAEEGVPFSHDMVVELARTRATTAYEPGRKTVPASLAELGYDQYRDIRFQPEQALLEGQFRMHLFHPGFLFTHPITVNIVEGGRARPVEYDPSLFDYGKNRFAETLPADLGFAGLRLHYPLNDPKVLDELIVFQGASYYRFLGRGQHYGLSTRGVALGSGFPGEEFPSFEQFWVEQPGPGSRSIVIHALLDGPSVAGAFRFTVYPDEMTAVDVDASFFPRRDLDRLGIAPLTSMFFVSENDRRIKTDYRPDVHDSDGLMLHTGAGEWIWRPLRNPNNTIVSSFMDENPNGFGLMQRERNFTRYEDLEARYDLRPSYWVEPRGDWGKGSVDLVELNGPDETSDNIVAFWRPDEVVRAGSRVDFGYTIRALTSGEGLHGGGRTVATFQTDPVAHGFKGEKPQHTRRFLIDFAGGELDFFLKAPDEVTVEPSTSGGRITASFLVPNPIRKGFRAGIDVTGEPGSTIDLRVFLKAGDRALTETWTFPWKVV